MALEKAVWIHLRFGQKNGGGAWAWHEQLFVLIFVVVTWKRPGRHFSTYVRESLLLVRDFFTRIMIWGILLFLKPFFFLIHFSMGTFRKSLSCENTGGSKTTFRLLALGDFCGILLLEEKIIQELFFWSDTDFCQQLNPRLILRFGAILAPKVDVILLVFFFFRPLKKLIWSIQRMTPNWLWQGLWYWALLTSSLQSMVTRFYLELLLFCHSMVGFSNRIWPWEGSQMYDLRMVVRFWLTKSYG